MMKMMKTTACMTMALGLALVFLGCASPARSEQEAGNFKRYRITDTIEVSGSDYAIASTGAGSGLAWGGADGGVMMWVTDPRGLRIGNLNFSGRNTAAHIRQVSNGQPSSVLYSDLFRLGDILIENKYPEYNQKTLANRPEPPTDAALAGVVAAFDHFRELGAVYLKSKAKD